MIEQVTDKLTIQLSTAEPLTEYLPPFSVYNETVLESCIPLFDKSFEELKFTEGNETDCMCSVQLIPDEFAIEITAEELAPRSVLTTSFSITLQDTKYFSDEFISKTL